MSVVLAPIVEGHGEVDAVPVLLRRMAPELIVRRPVRFPRNRLVQEEHLRRAARIASANIEREGAILMLIDSDEDCAARLGPDLEKRLSEFAPNLTCRVVLAVREFEAWIVGGDPANAIDDPDRAGNLIGRLREQHGVYKKTADQPRLIARSDLEILARRSRSYRHLEKVVREIQSLGRAGIGQ
ncbi:MAG: DUF4276 family protein [Phycisphaerae bacterium]